MGCCKLLLDKMSLFICRASRMKRPLNGAGDVDNGGGGNSDDGGGNGKPNDVSPLLLLLLLPLLNAFSLDIVVG